MSNTLGQRIRQFRLKKGLTQIELAKGLVTPSMVSQIESDRARPSYKVLVAIAARLDVPLEELLKDVNLDLEYISKYKMAKSMVRAQEYQTAIPLLNDLLEISLHRIPKEGLLLELALCHIELGNVQEAEEVLDQLYQLVNNGQNDRLAPVVLLQMGKVAALKSDFPIALFHTNRAWGELQKVEEFEADFHAKVLMQLAVLHEKVGKVAEAAKYYERALLLNQFNGEDRANTYLRLAIMYERQKKYEQAELYATKACVLLEEQANEEQRQAMQHHLIMLERGMSNWELSVQKLLTLVEQIERNGDNTRAGEVYADLGLICLENQELDEAWAYAEKARMRLSDDDSTMGKVYRVLSFVYFQRNDETKGQDHLDCAMRIFEQHSMVAELEEITLHVCRYLSDKGDHRAAFERMERFHQYMMGQLERRGIVL
ncbi:hypothetical protein CBW65_13850 [Tumebacillus avium]|uniref:HTH cro/C1-type domain-containing protein n=1 Tax=Tumebacillus avium TaxID=1903704 RepID=A0A1Y0IQ53_9BACL|nr:helix-turn-helix transcriptional regulator [Tumebacillus avium]ARU61966.1 hypothetical protein CBW65_13850 [Tumebacillus avium]